MPSYNDPMLAISKGVQFSLGKIKDLQGKTWVEVTGVDYNRELSAEEEENGFRTQQERDDYIEQLIDKICSIDRRNVLAKERKQTDPMGIVAEITPNTVYFHAQDSIKLIHQLKDLIEQYEMGLNESGVHEKGVEVALNPKPLIPTKDMSRIMAAIKTELLQNLIAGKMRDGSSADRGKEILESNWGELRAAIFRTLQEEVVTETATTKAKDGRSVVDSTMDSFRNAIQSTLQDVAFKDDAQKMDITGNMVGALTRYALENYITPLAVDARIRK